MYHCGCSFAAQCLYTCTTQKRVHNSYIMLVLQYILQDGAWRHSIYAVGTRQMLYKYMILWEQYNHKQRQTDTVSVLASLSVCLMPHSCVSDWLESTINVKNSIFCKGVMALQTLVHSPPAWALVYDISCVLGVCTASLSSSLAYRKCVSK